MKLRELKTPDVESLRKFVQMVESWERNDGSWSDDPLNKAIDQAFYGSLDRHCEHCGISAYFSRISVVGNLEGAMDFSEDLGWQLRTLNVGKDTASVLMVDADGKEVEGVGRLPSLAILSATFRGLIQKG